MIDIFKSLIEEKELPDKQYHRLIENFEFFNQQIKSIDLETIYKLKNFIRTHNFYADLVVAAI